MLTARVAETGHQAIAEKARRPGVEVSEMVRRLLAYGVTHMPDDWTPRR